MRRITLANIHDVSPPIAASTAAPIPIWSPPSIGWLGRIMMAIVLGLAIWSLVWISNEEKSRSNKDGILMSNATILQTEFLTLVNTTERLTDEILILANTTDKLTDETTALGERVIHTEDNILTIFADIIFLDGNVSLVDNRTGALEILLSEQLALVHENITDLFTRDMIQDGRLSSLETQDILLSGQLVLIQNQIQGLDGNITELSMLVMMKNNTERIAALEQKVEDLNATDSTQNNRLSILEARQVLDGNVTDLVMRDMIQDGRLSSLELLPGQLMLVESRIQVLEGNVTDLFMRDMIQDGRLSSLELLSGQIAFLQNQIQGLDGNITELSMLVMMKNNTERIIVLEQKVEDLNTTDSTQNERLSILEARQVLDGNVTDLVMRDMIQDGRLSSLETQDILLLGQIAFLQNQIQGLDGNITELSMLVMMKNNTDRITALEQKVEDLNVTDSTQNGRLSILEQLRDTDLAFVNGSLSNLDSRVELLENQAVVTQLALEDPPTPLATTPLNGNLLSLVGSTGNVSIGLRGEQSTNEASNMLLICNGDNAGAITTLTFFWLRIHRMVIMQVGAQGLGSVSKSAGFMFSLGISGCDPNAGLPNISWQPSSIVQAPVSISCSNGQFTGYAQMMSGTAPFLRVYIQQAISASGCVFNGFSMLWATDDP